MLKSDSRNRSLVGRMSCERGAASGGPKSSADDAHADFVSAGCLPDARLLQRCLRFRLALAQRRVEIGVGSGRELVAELVTQHAAAHFLDCARFQSPSWKGP
jgi:hypothetical protein